MNYIQAKWSYGGRNFDGDVHEIGSCHYKVNYDMEGVPLVTFTEEILRNREGIWISFGRVPFGVHEDTKEFYQVMGNAIDEGLKARNPTIRDGLESV